MGTEKRVARREVVRARIWVARVAKRRCHVVRRIALDLLVCLSVYFYGSGVVRIVDIRYPVAKLLVDRLDIGMEGETHEMV